MHASEALSHVARRLAVAGTDIGAALTLLANNALTLLAAEGAMVARIDGDQFRVEGAAGSLIPMVGFQAPLIGSLAADAVARGRAILVNEVQGDARVDVHFLAPFTPRHLAIAPILAGHEARGFLLALNSERNGFSTPDTITLQRLADFGAIALAHVTSRPHTELAVAVDEGCLSPVVREMNQSLELERVVSLLARHAARLTGAHGARVMLVEAAGLSIVAAVGDSADVVGTTVEPAGQFAQRAIELLSGVRTADLRSFADTWRCAPAADDEPGHEGRPNAIAVPLIVGSRAIGAVTVIGNGTRDFSDVDQSLLQSLADHAAIAVENARLYRAAAYMARHANVLAASARALAVNSTPEAVMAGISRVACTALGADGFSVFLANPTTRRVEMAHTEGVGTGIINWTPNRFWSMAAGEVTGTGVARYISDAESLYHSLTPSELVQYRAAHMRSIAFLPLPGDDGQRGVLVLRFLSPHRFDDAERHLLTDFATQVAVAIRNAQLAEAERASRDREGALKESMHQTEKLAALGELVAGVAHELNNPLTGISTFAQLLLEESLTEEQSESVHEIKREADRAVGVIRELLTFSRKTGPRLIAVDLNGLVQHTVRLRAYSLQSAGIEVRTQLDAVPPTAIGDDQRLQQVLLNLFVNAEYAMHRAPTRVLTIRTARQTIGGLPRVVIDITDTGTGMTPDVLPHIFEPFFTTKPAGVGTGLGLSVSYTIVQAHGGTIDVKSTPGTGTTFTVALPEYVASTNGRTAAPLSAAPARPTNGSARPTTSADSVAPELAHPADPSSDAAPGGHIPSKKKKPHVDR